MCFICYPSQKKLRWLAIKTSHAIKPDKKLNKMVNDKTVFQTIAQYLIPPVKKNCLNKKVLGSQ